MKRKQIATLMAKMSVLLILALMGASLTPIAQAAPSLSGLVASDNRYLSEADPTLNWNTFLGGTDVDLELDEGYAIAVDGDGYIYVAGASSAAWGGDPDPDPVLPFTGGDADAFVAKLSANGTLMWHTFLGGAGADKALSIVLDGSFIYVAGYSNATWDSPLGSPVRGYMGDADAFVARLNAGDGSLGWHTFLGGAGLDRAWGIDMAGSGTVCVGGVSGASWGTGTDTPVQGHSGGLDAFAACLNATTGALSWHTFMGGSGNDRGFAIATDSSNNLYVTGTMTGTWGAPPDPGPVRPYTGDYDAFVVKLAANGARDWFTFLGGSGYDHGWSITVDDAGRVYVAGYSGDDWGNPTRAYSGDNDAFAARLNASDGDLVWNTFLGGNGTDVGFAIVTDGGANVYLAGQSAGAWGNPVRTHTGDSPDALVARLEAATGALIWHTFLGGSDIDAAQGIAVDGDGNTFVTGDSRATWGSPVRAYSGGDDAFVASVPQPCIRSAISGDWSAGSSWIDGVIPSTLEGACIQNGHTITLDSSPQIAQLLVEAGGALVMPQGFNLTVENFVYSAGTMEQTQVVSDTSVSFLEIRNLAWTEVKYRGVEVNTSNDLGTVTARVRELNEGEYCTTDTILLTLPYASRCYEITATNNLAARVRLWSLNSDLNGILLDDLQVYRWVSPAWVPLTMSWTKGMDGDYSYAEGDTPGFSHFLLGRQGTPATAITLRHFSASGQASVMVAGLALLLLTVTGVTKLRLNHARRRL